MLAIATLGKERLSTAMNWKQYLEGRYLALTLSAVTCLLCIPGFWIVSNHPRWVMLLLLICIGLVATGIHDLRQERHAILRNYPVIGHLRFFFEKIRPEMRQ